MKDIVLYDKDELSSFRFQALGFSATGGSHAANEADNQDAFGFFQGKNSLALVVADGVGSCANSKKGAIYAVNSIKKLHEVIENGDLPLFESERIKQIIISEWKKQIKGPVTDYATTLRFAIMTYHCLLCGGIGDSEALFMIDNMIFNQASGENFFSNITYSLTQVIPESQFNLSVYNLDDEVASIKVLLTTDGIASEIDQEKKEAFLVYLASNLQKQGEMFNRELSEWINELQTKNGDDKTMILLTVERSSV